MKKNKILLFILIAIIIVLIGIIIFRDNNVSIKEYSNEDFSVNYDDTWKLVNKKEFCLEHKKSKSVFTMVVKDLDDTYIDTELSELINDIMFDIENQNSGFKLIDIEDD